MAVEPTTDVGPKKKLSKNTYLLIGGGAIILFFIYRSKKKKEEEGTGTANPYTAQSFIPVTGENVAGVGAGGYSGGAPAGESQAFSILQAAQKENTEFLTNFLKSSKEEKEANDKANKEFLTTLVGSLSGGGAPSQGQLAPAPVPVAPATGGGGSGATGTNRPSGCPSSFPNYNSRNGAPGPKSCYRISRERAKKSGYVIHGYQDGHEVESR